MTRAATTYRTEVHVIASHALAGNPLGDPATRELHLLLPEGHDHKRPLPLVFVLAGLGWMQISRVVRGQVLAVKEKEFVDAARAAGASNFRIITRHILPNCIGPIVVNATLAVAFAIVAESTLSFLGFGVQKPETSWGNLLFDAKGNVQFDTHLLYFPGLFILLTVLCINFVGDGLRDALDPQSGRD